jgi:hypothetical protein
MSAAAAANPRMMIPQQQQLQLRYNSSAVQLLDVPSLHRLFLWASAIVIVTYIALLAIVYATAAPDTIVYVNDAERQVLLIAFCMLAMSNVMILTPLFLSGRNTQRHSSNQGILLGACVTQAIAMVTTLLLACAPTVIMVDLVTHARVFLVRWCEWVPLGAFMTFFSEAIDIQKGPNQMRLHVLYSVSQGVSCLCGMLLPCCATQQQWNVVMAVSIATFLPIFPRVWNKRNNYVRAVKGLGYIELERYDRIRFSYHLLLTCAIVWTGLVVAYGVNMYIHYAFPIGHALRISSLAMLVDTAFDVVAKAVYMKLIFDVYFLVFDADGRAQRLLGELRSLMNILWDSSSDVIIISVRHADKITSMLSPSFPLLVGSSLPRNVAGRNATALFLDTVRRDVDGNPQGEDTDLITSASYVDSSDMPYQSMMRQTILTTLAATEPEIKKAVAFVAAGWSKFNETANSENGGDLHQLVSHPIQTVNGTAERQCEIKVSHHGENSMIAVVRDVTERYKRFEAEQMVQAETMARQRDAQSVRACR